MTNTSRLLPITLLLALCFSVGRAAAQEAHEGWVTPAAAFKDAEGAGKKIVVDIYTDWCGWCKRMDRDTYADPGVAAYMKEHYFAAKMNPEKEGSLPYDTTEVTYRDFAGALGVRGYPATAFFNEKGELLTVVSGYLKPKEFMRVLRFFGENVYLKQKWDEYNAAETAAGR